MGLFTVYQQPISLGLDWAGHMDPNLCFEGTLMFFEKNELGREF